MTDLMVLTLTKKAPAAHWGNADVTFENNQAVIHLKEGDQLRQIQQAARKLRSQGLMKLSLEGERWDLDSQWSLAQGFATAKSMPEIIWTGDEATQIALTHRLSSASFARYLVNETPENLAPVKLAILAAHWLSELGGDKVSYRIIEGDQLLEENWQGIHAVGRGSARPPAMLELDYNPLEGDASVSVALVGKGITFDSGGYSIKPSEGMLGMKCDMGGAATVTAALGLAIKQGLNKRIKLFLCCAENLISGNAYKLGDIITYKNGVTVEVVNTDAEGRLVLADGLQAACETGAKLVIDAATLTGAAVMAVGTNYNAIFSPKSEVLLKAQTKAAEVGERVWPLPLESWHRDMCPSAYADTANSRAMKGGGAGGASNAAGFLWRFVSPEVNWLHMDLASAFADQPNSLWAAGGTTHGMLTITALLQDS
ncbi:aminopeptidase PepB [Shewanella sp. VB17]|uniref:aminopeptidase PepB n=1 Tax=Shewanella sp. VB17 TaxID=2739432 RepID=UPI001565663A|nr:aminopeptidase PepB [Shewanella sp. VB17]NRD72448.1 aminopeptidase PepB [Shewanella sp. VB17]